MSVLSAIKSSNREDTNDINTTSEQCEYMEIKLNDKCGIKINEMLQQSQQKQTVKASSGGDSCNGSYVPKASPSTSSALLQQSPATATFVETENQKTSSSATSYSSSYNSTKKKKTETISTNITPLSSIQYLHTTEKIIKYSKSVLENQEL